MKQPRLSRGWSLCCITKTSCDGDGGVDSEMGDDVTDDSRDRVVELFGDEVVD